METEESQRNLLLAGPESQIKELGFYSEYVGASTGASEQGTGQARHGFGSCGERGGMR